MDVPVSESPRRGALLSLRERRKWPSPRVAKENISACVAAVCREVAKKAEEGEGARTTRAEHQHGAQCCNMKLYFLTNAMTLRCRSGKTLLARNHAKTHVLQKNRSVRRAPRALPMGFNPPGPRRKELRQRKTSGPASNTNGSRET